MTATVTTIHAPPPDAVAPPGFRAPEVCQLAKVSYRMLDYWTRLGIVGKPIVVDGLGRTVALDGRAPGIGFNRVWSQPDVVRIALVRVLTEFGVSVRKAAVIANSADTGSSHVEVTAWPVSLIVQMPEIEMPVSAAPSEVSVVTPCDFFASPHLIPDGAA